MLIVTIQLVVIIASARLFGALARRLGQPSVCGEIAAGLILGPSMLGKLSPEISARIFDPSVGQILAVVSQLGLVLLMFLIGMEFDFGHLKENRGTALWISVVGIVAPFVLGFGLGEGMHPALQLTGSPLHFSLFMAAAMSITAIPVLGRIMIEMNIHRTRIGALTISAAAVNDAIGWIIVALITAIVRSTFDPAKFAVMIGEVLVYGLVMVLVVRPALRKWATGHVRKHTGELSLNGFAAILVMVYVSAMITNLIGIFSIFGGFAMGAILFDQVELRKAILTRLNDFVTVFFLPVFFTYTGLRTDMGSMHGTLLWGCCALVLMTATLGKFGGCMVAARACGVSLRESAMIGALMNTRGLMELIVINIGYDLGIIPKTVFFMLVFMAVATTYMTSPLLGTLLQGTAYMADRSAKRVSSVAKV